jgi:hypothetical protein
MEFFGSDIEVEEEAYVRKLKGFWTEVIEHVEIELMIIATLSRNMAMVKESMPVKLHALQAGLFEAVHSNMLFRSCPITNKAFLNSHHKYMGAIMDTIHKVRNIALIIYHLIYIIVSRSSIGLNHSMCLDSNSACQCGWTTLGP